MGTINFTGTGGIWEGSAGAANVVINQDAALYFDGTGDNVTIADAVPEIGVNGAFTMSAWVKPNFVNNTKTIFADKSATADIFSCIVNAAGTQIGISHTVASGTNTSDLVAADVDNWNHLCVTRAASSTTIKYYINGVANGTDVSNTQNFPLGKIGSKSDNTSEFIGHIADVKLYNTEFTDIADIQALASKINIDYSIVGAGTQPIAWYKLNEGTGNPASLGSVTSAATRNNAAWQLGGPTDDPFSVNVQDNSTTTTGTTTVTQGKLECLGLSSMDLSGSNQYAKATMPAGSLGTTFTVSGWIRFDAASTGSSDYDYLFACGDGAGGSGTHVSIGRHADTGADAGKWYVYDGTAALPAVTVPSSTTWYHVTVVGQPVADGDRLAFYVNGVAETITQPASNFAITNTAVGLGAYVTGSANHYLAGKMRDVKTFDYALSAEQVASLYSGSYNVTPEHWWKLDEGFNSSGVAVPAGGTTGTLEDSGRGTDADATPWDNGTEGASDGGQMLVNGTLDLNSDLTIAANGTLSAPRGNLDLASNFDNLGTFTHNNGKVVSSSATYINSTSADVDPVFYNFESTAGQTRFYENTTIENNFTASGSAATTYIWTNKTITMGTATSPATLVNNSGTFWFYSYAGGQSSTLQGASSLHPIGVSGSSDFKFASDGGIAQLANVDWTIPFIHDGPTGYIKLTGDCEFDAVTIESGDTLDLNGQRMECSGILHNLGTVDGAASMLYMTGSGNYDDDGTETDFATLTLVQQGSSTTTTDYSTGFGTIFYNQAGVTQISAKLAATKHIVGSGTQTQTGASGATTDLTIATGATLNATDSTITCSGDFTTTGGLLGASCIELNGSSEYLSNGANADCTIANAWTIECWMKRMGSSGNEVILEMKKTGSNANRIWVNSDTGQIQVLIWNNTGASQVAMTTTGLTLNDSKWHHIATTYDGTTGEIYVDGKLYTEALLERTQDNTDLRHITIGKNVDANENYFTGNIDEVRIWSAVRTETEIRANMFKSGYANLSNNSALVAAWDFDEGTGSEALNKEDGSPNTALNLDLNDAIGPHPTSLWPAAYGTLTWIGGSTPSAGTLNMSGTGTLTYPHELKLFNLTLAASTKTTTLNSFPTNNKYLHIYGTLANGGGTITGTDHAGGTSQAASIKFLGSSTVTGNPILDYDSGMAYTHWQSTVDIPQMSTNMLMIDSIDVTLGGDHINDGYVRPASNRTLNFGTYTMTTSRFYMGDSNSGLNLNSGNLVFTGSSSEANANARLTGGPGCSISSSSSGNRRNMPSNPDWQIVGDLTDISIIDDGSWGTGYGITVIGKVKNCIGQIHQWAHTLDTDQLLDADELGSDDVKLSKPSLDNAEQLQTEG